MKILEKLNITEKELKRIIEGLDYLDLRTDEETIEEYYRNDIITINKGRDENNYIWISYNESKEVVINIETGEKITENEEIEKLFC